jgi:hypothetical protein
VPKAQRDALDAAIQELFDLGIQRYHGLPLLAALAQIFYLFDFLATLGSKGLVFSVCLADDFAILALGLIRRSQCRFLATLKENILSFPAQIVFLAS